MKRPWIATLATLSGLSVSLIAPIAATPTYASASKPTVGGDLKVAIANDVDGLDPQKTVSASTFEVTANIFDTLVRVNDKGELQPDLALKWASSQDAKTWTFKLRKGVKFHNGAGFNANDVVFTMKRMEDPATKSPRAKDFSIITKMTVDNPYQVTFTLSQPDVTFPQMMALPWAAILSKSGSSDLSKDPIGTGPFEFVSWTPQQSIDLKRNPHYFAPVYLNTAEFEVIPDSSTQLIDLQSGQVDVVAISDPEQAIEMKSDPSLTLINKPANMVQVLAINNKQKPFDNVLVRQAVNYAINRRAIIKAALWGYGTPIESHMPPVSPDYVNLNHTYSYNPQKARELLQKAGYGKGFSTTITLPQPYLVYLQMGQVIQQELRQVGIRVTLRTVDWSTWLGQVYFGRKYDMTLIGHTGRLTAGDLLNRYISSASENYMNFSDPTVDKDLTTAQATVNPRARKKLYQDVQRILAKDAASAYIDAPDALFGLAKDVHGWEVYPIDILDLRTVYKQG